MKNLRKGLLLLLLFCLFLSVTVIGASAATTVAGGKCGSGVNWILDSAGTLTISGTGKMDDFYPKFVGMSEIDMVPWKDYRESVYKVVIQPGVTYIGALSFFDCDEAASVTIPKTVTHIGESAFNGCSAIFDITIPNKVTTIGQYAFSGTNISEITLPDSVKKVGKNLFANCYQLTTVKLSKNLTELSDGMFSDCWKLENIQIPAKVTRIGDAAFMGCSRLSQITIPQKVTYIGASAFRECSNFTEITIPKSVRRMSHYVFYKCTALEKVCFLGSAPQVEKNSSIFGTNDANGSLVTIKVYYPAGDKTWTKAKQNQFGGDAEWNKREVTWIKVTAPKVTAQPKVGYAKLDETAQTTVRAKGTELTYTWYYKNAGGKKFYQDTQTENTYSAVINNASKNRTVYCVVTDVLGNTVRTKTVQLRMRATVKSYPESVTVAAGKNAGLTVRAAGDGLTYKWYYKNPDTAKFRLASVTGSTYTVKMEEKLSGQQVYCVVKDKYGKTAKTNVAWLYCKVTPKILTQPKTTYTPFGEETSVFVNASGAYTYQWYYKNAGDKKFTKDENQTDNTYSVTMDNATKDRIVYCVITSWDGIRVTSNKAILRTGVKITQASKNITTGVGKKLTLKVQATGEGLSYQWYSAQNGKKIAGATDAKYRFTAKSADDYYCVVKNKYGKTAQTDLIYVTVIGEEEDSGSGSQLAFAVQPENTSVRMGETGSVSVSLYGDPVKIQWYYKNAGDSAFSKAAQTGETYTFTMNSASRNRTVYCVATDASGAKVTSQKAVLRLAATITKQPQSVTVSGEDLGKSVTLSVGAVGDGLTYAWYLQGSDGRILKGTGKTCSFQVNVDLLQNYNTAYCEIEDKYGNSILSDYVSLRFEGAVCFNGYSGDVYIGLGETGGPFVDAEGTDLQYQWYYKDAGSTEFVKDNQTGAGYSVTMDSTTRDRTVYCVVTDAYGFQVTSPEMVLRLGLTITKQPEDILVTQEDVGKDVTLRVEAVGDGLTYQWYLWDYSTGEWETVSRSKTCTIKATADIVGNCIIYCRVEDQYGNNVDTANVGLKYLEKLAVTLPETVSARQGESKAIYAQVESDITYNVQWYYKNPGDDAFTEDTEWEGADTYWFNMDSQHINRIVYCVVTNSQGTSVTSGQTVLRSAAQFTSPLEESVSFSLEDLNQAVTVSVEAIGDGLTYCWYLSKDGNLEVDYVFPDTDSNCSFVLTAELLQNYEYISCTVTDQYGNTDNSMACWYCSG